MNEYEINISLNVALKDVLYRHYKNDKLNAVLIGGMAISYNYRIMVRLDDHNHFFLIKSLFNIGHGYIPGYNYQEFHDIQTAILLNLTYAREVRNFNNDK